MKLTDDVALRIVVLATTQARVDGHTKGAEEKVKKYIKHYCKLIKLTHDIYENSHGEDS